MNTLLFVGVHPDEDWYTQKCALFIQKFLSEDHRVLTIDLNRYIPYEKGMRFRIYNGSIYDLNRVFGPIKNDMYSQIKLAYEITHKVPYDTNNILDYWVAAFKENNIDIQEILAGSQDIKNGFFGYTNNELKEFLYTVIRVIKRIIVNEFDSQEPLRIVDIHAGLGEAAEISCFYKYTIGNNMEHYFDKVNHFSKVVTNTLLSQSYRTIELIALEIGIHSTQWHFQNVLRQVIDNIRQLSYSDNTRNHKKRYDELDSDLDNRYEWLRKFEEKDYSNCLKLLTLLKD